MLSKRKGGLERHTFLCLNSEAFPLLPFGHPVYMPLLFFLFPVLSPLTRDEITDYKNSKRGNFLLSKYRYIIMKIVIFAILFYCLIPLEITKIQTDTTQQ